MGDRKKAADLVLEGEKGGSYFVPYAVLEQHFTELFSANDQGQIDLAWWVAPYGDIPA